MNLNITLDRHAIGKIVEEYVRRMTGAEGDIDIKFENDPDADADDRRAGMDLRAFVFFKK